MSEGDLTAAILAHIRRSVRRQTPAAVASHLSTSQGVTHRNVRKAITRLLSDGALIYSYEMGCSFLLENPHRPWQVSPRIWILPPDCSPPESLPQAAALVRMQAGAAFGSEGHPTTRLCLEALAHLSEEGGGRSCFRGRAIDIGTGSGILALVAARLGSQPVLALDLDPCAREEARANVAINHLGHQVRVGGGAFETVNETHHLIIANLRYPTLVHMLPWAKKHLHPEGRIVVSGFLESESQGLRAHFGTAGFMECWAGSQKRWGAGCFRFKAFQGPDS